MLEQYTNAHGKECYRGVDPGTSMGNLEFHEVSCALPDERQWALHTNLGSITVLDRMTGFGHRDTETGYRDPEGKFWLASCMRDVRLSGVKTVQGAIDWIKHYAYTCTGD